MSLETATLPTEPGAPAALAAPGERTRIEYFRSYQQTVQGPNWVVNLLWGMLAFFSSGVIPIVGPMVWTGYLYECVEVLTTTRGRVFPDFDVNRFGDYITRGVWPFLVQLVIWIAIWATWFVVYVGMFVVLGLAGAAGDEYAPIVMAVGFPLLALALATVSVVPTALLAPLMLRAGLTQDLSSAVKLAWWGDFLKRVGLETALTTLFILLTGAILTSLGCVFVFIGSYVAWAWVTMASAHLSWQLYELYLARGGESVPLKPRELAPPPDRYLESGPPGYSLPPPANMT
ncbi:MAG TPA: DUF4013 domain-containing protein [Pirellulaceae bacterium]|nr:DUF4013 domain-containing protein [Pirellulaceae bacterium]